jgi:hypothetical protein
VAIVACFHAPTTTTVLAQTTGTTAGSTAGSTPGSATEVVGGTQGSTTTTALPPTTTTMNYCVEEKGMNQPLTIQPAQVKSNPSPDPTTPGDINPTGTTPGLDFPTPNPQINVTLDQPARLTVVYVPVDRPGQPSNVETFTVVFIYPDGTSSPSFNSKIPSPGATTTTTASSGASSETTTTPSTTAVFAPSAVSPQVDLPKNFQVPQGTVVSITITSTTDKRNPNDVCTVCFSRFSSCMTHFFCSAAKFSEIFKDVQQEHRMSQDELI